MKWLVIVPAALVGLIVVYFAILGGVSRSAVAPGLTDGQLHPCGTKPNAVCSQAQADSVYAIAPLPNKPLVIVKPLLVQLGGVITAEEGGYVAVEFKSALFGFVDDVELLIDETEDVLHVRSASRVGYSDMGVNRQRVEALRTLLEGQQ